MYALYTHENAAILWRTLHNYIFYIFMPHFANIEAKYLMTAGNTVT